MPPLLEVPETSLFEKVIMGTEAISDLISPWQAAVLGLVEGITEYLPVSSTGHLVVASQFLGLRDASQLTPDQLDAIAAFEIIIQSGAILAVIALYFQHLKSLLTGIFQRQAKAYQEVAKLFLAFSPAMVFGLALHKIIKQYLQHTIPVIAALIVGGLVMIWFEYSRWGARREKPGKPMSDLTYREALYIGLAQCLALWPGTSRSMTTILMGRICGMTPVAAAEFSFLLGLPTLLAATAYKTLKDGAVLAQHVSSSAMVIGLSVAALSAFFAVKGFVAFLNRRGLAFFGYYRIGFGILLIFIFGRQSL